MNFFKKRVKSRKTIYYVCGIPVYIKRLTTEDMAYNISKKIRKLEICAYPEITSLPPAVGQKREIQLANLKILIAVDKFCRKHNIRYWIATEPHSARLVTEILFRGMMILIYPCYVPITIK